MLDTIVNYAMGAVDPLLIILGLKLLLTPVPPRGLKFVVREVSQYFHTTPKSVQNQGHLEAAAIAICFLKEHDSISDRSLAYGFGMWKNEVGQMVRKGKWLIESNEEHKTFYGDLDVKYANAGWWVL